MAIKRPQLVNDEIYHVIIRGVGDAKIFKDQNDYYRMIFSLYEFNTTKPIEIRNRRKEARERKYGGQSSVNLFVDIDDRNLLVEILAFCFMPNHIHLLLRQIRNNGITKFMRKVGTGYSGYFNRRYDRRGHLFQSRFQAVHVKTNDQLQIVFVYIHANPVSLVEPKWKEVGVKNTNKIIKFIENYKWSSYLDYFDKKNFPSLTSREFLGNVIGKNEKCKKFVNDWIKHNIKL
ncbi:MAG TPA: transposase [Candidatus Portnoybacteria bacterium]|nr:transposase [Candidatus Portnoybacteria bacterium]